VSKVDFILCLSSQVSPAGETPAAASTDYPIEEEVGEWE